MALFSRIQIEKHHGPGGYDSRVSLNIGPFSFWGLCLSSVLLLAILISVVLLAASWMVPAEVKQQVALWDARLAAQQEELGQLSEQSQQDLNLISARLSELQARLARLDHVGQRMVADAGLDGNKRSATKTEQVMPPATETSPGQAALMQSIETLAAELRQQELYMSQLNAALGSGDFSHYGFGMSGWPLLSGGISSAFGLRTDPFNGRPKMHSGIDLAGHDGADILSVQSGRVIWSGEKGSYGNVVDIDHGNGYVSRYAHNKKNLVSAGDTVQKGQVIAQVGSSGRSTGPHLHFEIYKYGKARDPLFYIRRPQG